ncbi:dUTP pyrophosphatase [Thermotomaculum hydrothermale]|uniref:Deoxyuridine 5'-triphosphate nucleotidohydrolase n=1 Tax=Thermotomaculum hydrothermale TaxID=981385 RepID=A0A7R6PSH1_9BACT|nr:dUTP diphosphatase [Thermotomaculum hydrothermale]BBB33506.1 dUTP pyrophosphatase [Thermotomaculum hydrothermale]
MVKKIDVKVKVLKHAEGIDLPAYQTIHSSGMDIRAAVEKQVILKKGEVKAIETGLIFAIPEGFEIQIRPRSGLALKHGITCLNTPGTIDADYRGEVKVILANLGKEDFVIERGMRIAQAVLCPVFQANLIKVDDIDSTERGSGGFGSTGVK